MRTLRNVLRRLTMENNNIEQKVFFLPGDLVTLRQDIPNKPVMIVVKKETMTFKNNEIKEDYFKGMRCRWFTTEGQLQEAIFSTKDLQKL